MVDAVPRGFRAKAHRVVALYPTEVGGGEVLVVAEDERIGDVGIPKRTIAADREERIAALKQLRSVGPGNSQNVGAVVLVDIGILASDALPGIADVAIHQNRGRNRIGAADGGVLNRAGSVPRLPASERGAAGGSQAGWIEDVVRRVTIAGEDR